jgi:hypothetical protein
MALDYCYVPRNSEWEYSASQLDRPETRPRIPHQGEIDEWIVQLDESWFPKALDAPPTVELTVEDRFQKLADDWSRETIHISSVSDLVRDTRYREIVALGWDVVPYLLADLRENGRFWFPALAEITGIRPYDRGDSSNPRRMTEAWLRWGKWKGLI